MKRFNVILLAAVMIGCANDPAVEIESAVKLYYSKPRPLSSQSLAMKAAANAMQRAADEVARSARKLDEIGSSPNPPINGNPAFRSTPAQNIPGPTAEPTPYPPYKVLGISYERRDDQLYVVKVDLEKPGGERTLETLFARKYISDGKSYWKVDPYVASQDKTKPKK